MPLTQSSQRICLLTFVLFTAAIDVARADLWDAPLFDLAAHSSDYMPNGVAISGDGRFVVFTQLAAYTWLWDRALGTVAQLPLEDSSGSPLLYVQRPELTADGVWLYFDTSSALIPDDGDAVCEPGPEDCNSSDDVYRYNLIYGSLERVSFTEAGTEIDGFCFLRGISADGMRVLMACSAQNIAADQEGHAGLFVRDLRDEDAPHTWRVTETPAGARPDADCSVPAAISGDGNRVAFGCMASDLVNNDTNGVSDVFLHSVDDRWIERISVGSEGEQLDVPSGVELDEGGVAIDFEGEHVVFTTMADIDPLDLVSAVADVYLYDVTTEESIAVSLRYDPGGAGGWGTSWQPQISADGELVVFLSMDPNLVSEQMGVQRLLLYSWQRSMRQIDELTVNEDGVSADGLTQMPALSLDGSRVAFVTRATNLAPGVAAGAFASVQSTPPLRDRDGDGLLDSWEEEGIDGDGDGDPDYILENADPDHKDLYVELDWLATGTHSHRLDPRADTALVNAFAAAPVENPDGEDGIVLHLEYSDRISETAANMSLDDWTEFDPLKANWFGTDLEFLDPAILAAKRRAFRYVLLAHSRDGTTSSGIGELPGNDFIVTLGSAPGNIGTPDDQAATLMHELGHTLSLRHGGSDDWNCKPNYLSIMSYTFQFRSLDRARPLDYSREELVGLDETSLSESVGIASITHRRTFFGPPVNVGGKLVVYRAWADEAIDWNASGVADADGIAANINDMPSCRDARMPNVAYSPANQVLETQEDWSLLRYNFRGAADYADGVHTALPDEEMTWEQVLASVDSSEEARNEVPTAMAEITTSISEPVAAGTVIDLSGSGSADPEGAPLTFDWQRSGEPVFEITGADSITASLTVPEAAEDTTIAIALSVSDGVWWSAPSWIEIQVEGTGVSMDGGPDASAGDGGMGPSGGGCATTSGSSTTSPWDALCLAGGLLIRIRRRKKHVAKYASCSQSPERWQHSPRSAASRGRADKLPRR